VPAKLLTDAQIRALPPIPKGGKRAVMSCGDGLMVVNDPVVGSKPCIRFVHRYFQKVQGREKPKQNELSLGSYGKGGGKISLAQARQKLRAFKEWRSEQGLYAHHDDWLKKQNIPQQQTSMLLSEVCQLWLASPARLKKSLSTQQECRRHLENHVLKILPADVTIKDMEWDSGNGSGGRELFEKVKSTIQARQSYDMACRVGRTLKQVCDFAIEKGWMRRDQNPCSMSADDRSLHVPKGNPTISSEEVSTLFKAVEDYSSGRIDIVVLALKLHFLLCTRPGALVALRWSWIDEKNSLITIPGDTPGLKRPVDQRDIDHLIPITDLVLDALEHLKRINGNHETVFFSPRGKKYEHINPSALNNLLKVQLNYKGKLTAQGWRDVVQTVGQDVLNYQWEVPDRQLGHLAHKKGVRGHYDNSELLDKRREFMNDWSNWCINQGLVIP
jgi:integrase